jgi:hypothetical protein
MLAVAFALQVFLMCTCSMACDSRQSTKEMLSDKRRLEGGARVCLDRGFEKSGEK